MTATEVFNQNNGDVTRAYYAEMNERGLMGQLAVALFRAQKRSTAAKKYRGGGYRRDAYDVKNWSLFEVCRILSQGGHEIEWGWGHDDKTPGFEHVLYVELPQGQVSFHSGNRMEGPDYEKPWDGQKGMSVKRILAFCDSVAGMSNEELERFRPAEPSVISEAPISNPWDRMKQELSR